MNKLVSKLENYISGDIDESIAISAIVLKNEIGYPERLIKGDSNEGEFEGFNEIYDYAQDLFDTEKIKIEREDKYIWFIDNSNT